MTRPVSTSFALFVIFGAVLAATASDSHAPLANTETERLHKIEKGLAQAKTQDEVLAALRAGWTNPPTTFRPHCYWWWPGNDVTKEGIDYDLEQMREKGLGGARIVTFWNIYQKGNVDYGSPEFLSMVGYTVKKARELGLQIELTLGPGWNLGNQFVAPDDRSKTMAITEVDVPGGDLSHLALTPPVEPKNIINQRKELDAVIAVALKADGTPDTTQRVDLSTGIEGDRTFAVQPDLKLSGHLPDGKWKLMQFWTTYTGQHNTCAPVTKPAPFVVDYLNKDSVRRAEDAMGSRFRSVAGDDFGATVDGFASDSPELTEAFSLWSTGLYERFQKEKGYDLRPYLPLLRYDGAPETAYVRYDFGSFLNDVGMEGFIGTEADYAAENHVEMRQQVHYRFTTELIQASGRLHTPETELTRRSFDPTAYPHKLTVSGAQLYPSKEKSWTSTEAFTFIDFDKYRVTMTQIKQATDSFIRDGIAQLFNNGSIYMPEKEVAPSRDLPAWANPINHENTWWPYYRTLADYQARACFMNRESRSAAQVLLYSPMPSIWSKQATFVEGRFLGGGGVRGIPFGVIPKLLVASGYDFDCVNDDLLQHYAKVEDGKLVINGYRYGALVLPRALCLAPETLKIIDQFVRAGGTVFALNTLPDHSPGLVNHEENDKQVKQLLAGLFAPQGGSRAVEKGMTFFLPGCDGLDRFVFSPNAVDWAPTDPPSPAYAEFIKDLRSRLQPDFDIAGTPLSNGLTFRHTTIGPVDVWFITNQEPVAAKTEVVLKTRGQFAQIWNPLTAAIQGLPGVRSADDGRLGIPVDLQPWESTYVITTPAADPSIQPKPNLVQDAPVPVQGTWQVEFNGLGGAHSQTTLPRLADWITLPGLRDFSGTATYTIKADVPAESALAGKTIFLDLGDVHEAAAVKINGHDAGTAWMAPYRVNVSGLLHPGANDIEIRVSNLIWNYAASLAQPTPIPPEIEAHYGGEPTAMFGWKTLQKSKERFNNDRLPSGLAGPVTWVGYRAAN